MKYLKYFDVLYYGPTDESKFKIGDIIYCINTEGSTKLKKDIPYIVTDIRASTTDPKNIIYFYDIKNSIPYKYFDDIQSFVLDRVNGSGLGQERFISELEYNANKYNIG